MSAKPKQQKLTPEEYLAIEEKAKERSEYWDGDTFVMSGGSIEHIQITFNVAKILDSQLARSCRVLPTEMKVWVKQMRTFFYPDVTVVCGEIKFYEQRRDVLTNPTLLVEVLSDSTKDYDRTDKFLAYRKLESFKEYILIDQKRALIEQYIRKTKKDWTFLPTIGLDSSVKLSSVQAILELKKVYDLVEL